MMIDVFFGAPQEHHSERRALERLRRELTQRGTPAKIFANFVAGRPQRQIDFLVVTPHRCVMIELKTVDQQLPLVGHANGPWEQRLAHGSRLMDRNFYVQAREATYAVSDAMREVDSDGARKFFRQIDTVICLAPGIPPGSTFDAFDYVDVIGFEELVDRLTSPGRSPTWGLDEWDSFARALRVHREIDDSPEALRRRAAAESVQDYRRRFHSSFAIGLHELVPLSVAVDGSDMESTILASCPFPANSTTLVLGPSGSGKSHLALHAALRAGEKDHLSIWLRCDEYERGRLSSLLARAIAPFSTEQPVALLQKSLDLGLNVLIVLDGLNGCTDESRTELFQQLSALRLRIPSAVLATSTIKPQTADIVALTEIVVHRPHGDERERLLASHGLPEGAVVPDAFSTPFELSLAAMCFGELSAAASQTELLDTYIRMSGVSEEIRFGLRTVAGLMDDSLRMSIPLTDAYAAVRRKGLSPAAIDKTMASPLLVVQQGRIRFRHELFARFLSAEHLVAISADGHALGQALAQPSHLDLSRHGIILERDHQRRHDALLRLGDSRLLADAARGAFGQGTANKVLFSMKLLLDKACHALSEATFISTNPDDAFAARWVSASPWTDTERSLLSAIGLGLADGILEVEIGELLDRTDAACYSHVAVLREAGGRIPITVLIAATYATPRLSDPTALPASIIADVVHTSSFERWGTEADAGVASSLWRDSREWSWGRLFLAALLSQPVRHPDDANSLPALVRAGWSARGYHLQLQVLMAAETGAQLLNAEQRSQMVEVLETFETSNIMLSTQLVETLAAYDMITAISTLEDIKAHIDAVLAAPDDAQATGVAQGIVSNMFERDDIVGPYYDAVSSLTERERAQVLVLAARSEQPGFNLDWVIGQLADFAPSMGGLVRETLGREAAAVRRDVMMPQVAIMAHLHALRGWAQIESDLPPWSKSISDAQEQAWRCFDQIIFDLHRGIDPAKSTQMWDRLLSDLAPNAVQILHSIRSADRTPTRIPVASLLHERYPQELQTLFEWALKNLDAVTASHQLFGRDQLVQFIIQTLGRIGSKTAANALRELVSDTEMGEHAVNAIREIEARSAT
jgi:hypothetical protein